MAGPDPDVLGDLLRRVSGGDAAAPVPDDGESSAAQAAGGLLAWSEDPHVARALAEAGFVDVAARLMNEASSDMLMARVAGTLATAAAAEPGVAPRVGNAAALLAGCEAALQYSGDPDLLAEASRLLHTVSACVRRASGEAPSAIAAAWTGAALRRLPRLMDIALRAQHETLVGRVVGLAHHLHAVSPDARTVLAGPLCGLRWTRAMLLCQRRAVMYADRGPASLLALVAALAEAGGDPPPSLGDAVEIALLCAKVRDCTTQAPALRPGSRMPPSLLLPRAEASVRRRAAADGGAGGARRWRHRHRVGRGRRCER